MNDFAETDRRPLLRQFMWAGVMVALTLIALLIVRARPDNNRAMKPARPTPARVQFVIDAQPLLVTFDELNSDPNNFVGQRLRVNGDFTPLDVPSCLHRSGPVFYWALVSGSFQLDALGYEAIVRLIPEGTPMTIEGFWRRYSGPLGCGKKPPTARVWYLEVTQIVQPNPLPNFGDVLAGDGREPLTGEPLTGEPLTTPAPVEEPIAEFPTAPELPTETAMPTAVTPVTGSSTAVAPGTTLTATPTGTPRVAATPTPTRSAPGVTATSPAGGAPTPTTSAATPPAVPSPTPPAGGYPPPPSGGYP